jgi:orotidine-5'-phosphate decarboxylase
MTPSLAFQKGADYLVIGRPIIEAASPQKAFLRIVEESDHT